MNYKQLVGAIKASPRLVCFNFLQKLSSHKETPIISKNSLNRITCMRSIAHLITPFYHTTFLESFLFCGYIWVWKFEKRVKESYIIIASAKMTCTRLHNKICFHDSFHCWCTLPKNKMCHLASTKCTCNCFQMCH